MQVSIVIINYNTYDLTCQCISSVIEYTKDIEYEIILVDNASTECDSALFLDKFPNIILIKSPVNTGFAGGNNLGIKESKGEYILLLNSDTYLLENSIKLSIDRIRKDESIGVLSCKLIYPDGRVQATYSRFPSIAISLFETLRLQKIFPKFGSKYLLSSFYDGNNEIEVDWVWGAFFLMPRTLIIKLPEGKLSERFFMYCEDMEWCYQIKKLGYKVLYYPETPTVHLLGGSNSKTKVKSILNNRAIFMSHNYNKFHIILIRFCERLLMRSQVKKL